MAATFEPQYVILCDDIREEIGGKTTVVGMYHERIVIDKPASGFAMPIAFFIYGHVSGKKSSHVELWIENPDGSQGQKVEWEQIEAPATGDVEPAMLMWKLFPWRGPELGSYKLRMKQGARTETIYQFAVEGRVESE
jgi:hypothetical protein